MKKNTTQYKLVALNTAIPIPAETENSHIAKAKAIAIGMQVGLLVNTLYDQLFVKEVKDRDPMAIVSAGTALCALAATHISAAMKSETAQETSTRLTQASKLFRLGMYATNTAQVGLKIAGNIASTPLVVMASLISQTAKLFGISEWLGKKAAGLADSYLPTSVSRVVKPYIEHLLPFAAYTALPSVSVGHDDSLVVTTLAGNIVYQTIPAQMAHTLFPESVGIPTEGEVYVRVNEDGTMTPALTAKDIANLFKGAEKTPILGQNPHDSTHGIPTDSVADEEFFDSFDEKGYMKFSPEPEDEYHDALEYQPEHRLSRRNTVSDQGQNLTLTGLPNTGFGSRVQFLGDNQLVISAPQGNGAVYILSTNMSISLADGLPMGATNISSATGMKMGTVISVFDINGDAEPDVIMQGPGGLHYLLGTESGFPARVDFDLLPRINGTRVGDGNVQAVGTIADGKILMASRADGTVALISSLRGVENSLPADPTSTVVSSLFTHGDQLGAGTRLSHAANGEVRLFSIGQNITLNTTYDGETGARLGAAALSFLGSDGKPILVLGATGEESLTGALNVMFSNSSSQVLRGEIPGGLFGSNLMVSGNTFFVTAQNAGTVYKFDIGNGFPANLSAAIKYSGTPQSFGTALATSNGNYVIGDPSSNRVLIFFAPSSPVTPTISPTSESSGGANIAVITGAVVGGVVVVFGGVVVYKKVIQPMRQVAAGENHGQEFPVFNVDNPAFVRNYEEPIPNPRHVDGIYGFDGQYQAARQPVIPALNWDAYMLDLQQPGVVVVANLHQNYAALGQGHALYAPGQNVPVANDYEEAVDHNLGHIGGVYDGGIYRPNQATLRRNEPRPVTPDPHDYEEPDDEA